MSRIADNFTTASLLQALSKVSHCSVT